MKTEMKEYTLPEIASQIRRDIIRMVTTAKSGHPGGSLSSTDFLTYLFFQEMDQTPETWRRDGKGQDMFFLSAGHLAPVLYAVLARRGYFPLSELGTLREYGSMLQGHPSVRNGMKGIEQAAGSLGQGLSVALGAALAKKMNNDGHTVFCLTGDGESEEGQIWEAAHFGAHHGIDNLIAFTDYNGQQIDGTTQDIAGFHKDLREKWLSFGWNCFEADGHDFDSIKLAFGKGKEARGSGKPVMILFRTVMGKGVDFMEGTNKWHGKAPSEEQCTAALGQLKETMGDY
ncbi:MAG: transketolase [Bacteroidales bacterium]|nr:transketolase [Bacteroidales bacterium]MCI2121192.1 transketolase [Bacteroidales bacterium]MCI2145020.1 transketolase [Bacteroidales bacterium]